MKYLLVTEDTEQTFYGSLENVLQKVRNYIGDYDDPDNMHYTIREQLVVYPLDKENDNKYIENMKSLPAQKVADLIIGVKVVKKSRSGKTITRSTIKKSTRFTRSTVKKSRRSARSARSAIKKSRRSRRSRRSTVKRSAVRRSAVKERKHFWI